MIAIEIIIAYGSLPDTAEMIIPTKILSMSVVEVVVAYGSLPDPAEVVIPRFSQRLLLKLKSSKVLSPFLLR